MRGFRVEPEENEFFEQCITLYGQILRYIEPIPEQWHFIEIAWGYFIKAYFADGLEQLLWHITTLEALLGEKRRGNYSATCEQGFFDFRGHKKPKERTAKTL